MSTAFILPYLSLVEGLDEQSLDKIALVIPVRSGMGNVSTALAALLLRSIGTRRIWLMIPVQQGVTAADVISRLKAIFEPKTVAVSVHGARHSRMLVSVSLPSETTPLESEPSAVGSAIS